MNRTLEALRRSRTLLFGFLALLVTSPVFAGESHSDAVISLRVHVTLVEKLGGDALRINVNTLEGHVQLAGTVAKRETRELAENIAQSVPGVTAVDNDIRTTKEITGSDKVDIAAKEVEHETKDALLAGKVRLELLNKMGTDAFKVHVDTANRVVYLSFSEGLGKAEREKAQQLATATEGVKKVIAHD